MVTKIRHGVNLPQVSDYQATLLSPNLMCQARLVDVSKLQTTLAADYVPGSYRLRFASGTFPEGPAFYPGAYVAQEIYVHTPGGPLRLYGEKYAGDPWYRIALSGAEKTAFDNRTDFAQWTTGMRVDGERRTWGNPNGGALTEYVRSDGRRTGFPAGLTTGQYIQLPVINSAATHISLPAGNWTIRAKGTGQVQLAVSHRDGAGDVGVITFTNGIASGPLTVTSQQGNAVSLELQASDPSNPLHDLQIIIPGTMPSDDPQYPGLTFAAVYALNDDNPAFFLQHPNMVGNLKHATHIRFGDFMDTIQIYGADYSGVTSLASRTTPTHGLGKTNYTVQGEPPWEWTFKIANESGCNHWVAVGKEWADETIAAFMAMAKATLLPHLRLMVTDDIETWNGQFLASVANAVRGAGRFHNRVPSSFTYNSGTGKARVTRKNHGVVDGDQVFVLGTSDPAYVGTFTASNCDADGFSFTTAGTPSGASPTPRVDQSPAAFKVGTGKTFAVTRLRQLLAGSVETFAYPFAGLIIDTAEDNAIQNGEVIAIEGCATPGVDGLYQATRWPALAANQTALAYKGSGLHYPQLPPTPDDVDHAPVAGQVIRGAVLSRDDASRGDSDGTIFSAEAQGRYHGYRIAHITKMAMDAFEGEWDRLTCIADGWAGGIAYNRWTLAQIKREFGGKLPPIVEVLLTMADYAEPKVDQRQREDYVGNGLQQLARTLDGQGHPVGYDMEITVSGGVATATCGQRWVDEIAGPIVSTHDLAPGDDILLQLACWYSPGDTSRATPHWVQGRFTVASTPSSTTFTIATPGVPDGKLETPPGAYGAFIVKGASKGWTIESYTMAGGQITYRAPGHALAPGDKVGVGLVTTIEHFGVFDVLATTPGVSFTVANPVAFGPGFRPPGDGSGGRFACCFAATEELLSAYGEAVQRHRDDPERLAWYDNLTKPALENPGVITGLYEMGDQRATEAVVNWVPWAGQAMNLSQFHPSMVDTVLDKAEQWKENGLSLVTAYQMTGDWDVNGSGFGYIPWDGAENKAQNWQGFLQSIAANGAPRSAPPGPATKFTITVPLELAKVGEYPGQVAVGPDGVLDAETTVALSGPGGDFDPPTLTFPAGSSSPLPSTYTPTGAGRRTLTGAVSPSLGTNPTAFFTALDEDGNPGNATAIFSGDFAQSANGAIPSPLVCNPNDSATIAGGKLHLAPTGGGFNSMALVANDGTPSLDSMVKFTCRGNLLTSTGGPAAIHRASVDEFGRPRLGSPASQYEVVYRVDNGHIYVFGTKTGSGLGDVSGADFFLGGSAFDMTHEIEFTSRCQGTPAVFSIHVEDKTAGTVLFDKAGLALNFGADITEPGYSGVALNSYASYPAGGIDVGQLKVSKLGAITATGYALSLSAGSGPVGTPITVTASLAGGNDLPSTMTITLASSGGTFSGPIVIAPGVTGGTATFTPTSSGVKSITASHSGGGTISDPSAASFTATSAQQQATAYTLAVSPTSGLVGASATVTVTPNGPYTGTIAVAKSGAGLSGSTTLTFSDSSVAQTFQVAPSAAGTLTLAGTNSGSLSNPTAATYTATAPVVVRRVAVRRNPS